MLEEDEVHSVARLLGELVNYRATGTGHLELLTGSYSYYSNSICIGPMAFQNVCCVQPFELNGLLHENKFSLVLARKT